MTFLNPNPPAINRTNLTSSTSVSFHFGPRNEAITGNYENELSNWAGNDPDRSKIANQIIEQGGARAKLLRLEDLSVHDEAPPLPPQVDTIILSFTSTNSSVIQDIITTLICQALDTIPPDVKLAIFYDLHYSMNRSEIASMINDIQIDLLKANLPEHERPNISLKPVKEPEATTTVIATDEPDGNQLSGLDVDDKIDNDDIEFFDQIEGNGRDNIEDQIEGDSSPATGTQSTTLLRFRL